MSQGRVIAIIGGGFSGTMAAVHLATKAKEPLEILLIERSGPFARGVAYGTTDSSHLLNVQARNMSAFPEKPDHFVLWARDHGIKETDFAPRQLYGEYLTEVFRQARESANGGITLREIADEAIGIERDEKSLHIQFKQGGSVQADEVILALGNFPAGPVGKLPFRTDEGVRVTGAWEQGAIAEIDPDDRVLILGSGLTMIDTVLTLKGHGSRAPIQVVSRHGYLPQTFEPGVPQPSPLLKPGEGWSLASALRKIRFGEAGNKTSWYSRIGSLRSATPALWRGLSQPERRRFLRHLRTLWDSHRHQMAPDIGRKIKTWLGDGSLVTRAGRILSLEARGGKILVTLKGRGATAPDSFTVDHVINCMGIEGNFATMKHPLIESLRNQGLIRPDALGLGIEVTREGKVLQDEGSPSAQMFALGSLRRAECWESVAVPELRVQAQELANLLCAKRKIENHVASHAPLSSLSLD